MRISSSMPCAMHTMETGCIILVGITENKVIWYHKPQATHILRQIQADLAYREGDANLTFEGEEFDQNNAFGAIRVSCYAVTKELQEIYIPGIESMPSDQPLQEDV